MTHGDCSRMSIIVTWLCSPLVQDTWKLARISAVTKCFVISRLQAPFQKSSLINLLRVLVWLTKSTSLPGYPFSKQWTERHQVTLLNFAVPVLSDAKVSMSPQTPVRLSKIRSNLQRGLKTWALICRHMDLKSLTPCSKPSNLDVSKDLGVIHHEFSQPAHRHS